MTGTMPNLVTHSVIVSPSLRTIAKGSPAWSHKALKRCTLS